MMNIATKKNHFRGPCEMVLRRSSEGLREKIKNKTENPHHARPYDLLMVDP